MLEKLQELLRQKKSKTFYADKLGITVKEVEELLAELRGEESKEEVELSIEGNTQRFDFDKGTAEISAYYDHPPTAEEILLDHKIDSTKYKLSAFYTKGKGDKGWLVTALLKNITKEEEDVNKFVDFLSTYKTPHKPFEATEINDIFESKSSLVLSLCDFHLGKEDRVMVPLQERLNLYRDTVNQLVRKSYSAYNLEEIVFVIGNDMFQCDTVHGTTVKGTPVGNSERWDSIYEVGFNLMVETFNILLNYTENLKIVLIPGNHSESKEYYLSHALDVYYNNDSRISFDRTSEKYKAHLYGSTALYFNHGDNINEKLPLMFAKTFSSVWGQAKYHEILLGDKHHNSEKSFKRSQSEAQGVRMRILPSLSNTDQWHYDNLFTNSIQAGIALIYDKEKGKCAEFEHRI